ncbi:conserved protein of unknown function [Limnospira indica PCC 8005]|uniref:Uncharacterized protein n=1 Tax=Limnospira indica PCC 8005 TaxID=376219 RepID=A0A9P1P165_9CYAN|nr:conserved protein of unknown function [Limnospira indica PCC 8005]
MVGLDLFSSSFDDERQNLCFRPLTGELVGLDPIPLETLRYAVFKVRSREST